MDDVDVKGIQGGKLYSSYGIDAEGAFAVVRPDGYVATALRLEDTAGLEAYFAAFMV